MGQDWCGPLFASEAVGETEGTLPLALVGGEGRRAPDLAMSFAWDPRPNADGWPGYVASAGDHAADHGSISTTEVHNVFVAAGPSFKRGVTVGSPSSNVDVAPTILRLLGISTEGAMDGRPLKEAMVEGSPVEWDTEVADATSRVAGVTYSQELTVSRAEGTLYPDHGRTYQE